MPEVSLNAWKEYIDAHPQAHLLQTAEWGELKSAFGWEPVYVIRDGLGAQLLFRKLPLGLTVAYIPKPLFDPLQDAARALRHELEAICERRAALFLKIEPDEWITAQEAGRQTVSRAVPDENSYRTSRFNIQPPRTLIVDLRGGEQPVLARMKQKCRYNIRLAEKKGVTVRPWDDTDGFHKLLQVTGGRDGFAVHSADYYRRAFALFREGDRCQLLLAEYEGTPLAALMVFRQGTRAWYLYGASNDVERNRMPTYLLQWEAMRWALAHGCEEYDLWGVPDADEQTLEANFETRQDGLWGVYRFKRGFGGELKRAAQAVDRVFNPLLYRLYVWRMAGREAG